MCHTISMKYRNDFLWGASTAGHQVDGESADQWTVWEKANAERLALTAEKRLDWLPNWDTISRQASQPSNYLSGNGVGHQQRYTQDFDILTTLHMNAFRCGIEWSKLEPQEGSWDTDAIEYYRQYFNELKQRGITPIVTLWHWTMPVWFTDKGGFAKRKNLRYFERYVAKVAELFANDLSYVITLNEPNVYATFGYLNGEWPPQAKSPVLAVVAYHNLMLAHRRAYHILKAANPNIQVGIAAQLADMQPTKPGSILNKLSISISSWGWNWWFLNKIRGQQDFIGVNYYFTQYQDWLGRIRNPKTPVSDLGWYMEPAGISRLLTATWERYHTPLIVTENGLADSSDEQRRWWLEQTMPALEKAIESGVDMRGYLHWSLLDNFEWAYGWWPEFGLVHVDRSTMQRTIRPSALWLASYIEGHKQLDA